MKHDELLNAVWQSEDPGSDDCCSSVLSATDLVWEVVAAAAAGSGKGSSSAKENAAISKKLEQLQKGTAKLMVGSTPKKAGKYWTCVSCGDELCFVSRQDCHACGAARDLPPGLKSTASCEGCSGQGGGYGGGGQQLADVQATVMAASFQHVLLQSMAPNPINL